MGAEQAMGQDRRKPLSRSHEIEMIGHGSLDADGNKAWLELLRGNRELAREFRFLYEQVSQSLAQAYPGETRDPNISPQEMRENGYEDLAEEAELMGLTHL